jgi:hypothetical protein
MQGIVMVFIDIPLPAHCAALTNGNTCNGQLSNGAYGRKAEHYGTRCNYDIQALQ